MWDASQNPTRLPSGMRCTRRKACKTMRHPAGPAYLYASGATHSPGAIALPLFVVILGAVMVGVLVGFVWEWLREHRHRADAKLHKRAAQSLEREVKTLKGGTGQDAQDDILALVDGTGPAR